MFYDGLLGFFNRVFFFTSYVGDGGSFPKPLSKEEEKQCLEKAKAGDNEAKETLIRHNLRLVAHIVKKYSNCGDVDDLISIGSIGLIKGINTYKYGKGTVLATYVSRCVENEILMHLRRTKKLKLNISLSESIGRDKDGNELKIMDILSTDEEDVFKQVDEEIQHEKLIEFLKEHLNNREYRIIIMRYGLHGEDRMTQAETAKVLGISRSYISRIEKKAIEKLRKVLPKENYFM